MTKLQEVLDELDAKDEQLNGMKAELEQRDEDLHMAGKIGESLLEKNQSLEEEIANLRHEQSNQDEGHNYREEYEIFKRRHEHSESAYRQAQVELEAKYAEITRLEDKLREEERRATRTAHLRAEGPQGDDEGSDDENSTAAIREERDSLRKEVSKLKNRLAKAHRTATNTDETISDMYEQLNSKNRTISSLRSQLEEAAAHMCDLEVAEVELKSEHARSEAAAKAECNRLQKVNAALQQQLEDSQATIEGMQREKAGDIATLSLSDDEEVGLGDLHMGSDGSLGNMKEIELEAELDRLKGELVVIEEHAAATQEQLKSQLQTQKDKFAADTEELQGQIKLLKDKSKDREHEAEARFNKAASDFAEQTRSLEQSLEVRFECWLCGLIVFERCVLVSTKNDNCRFASVY